MAPALLPLRLRDLIPLRDARIKVPTVIVNALAARLEIGQQLADSGEIVTFKVSEADDHVGDLDPGVVDVVLHVHMLPGSTQQAHKGVAEDCVAQMADVRGLIRVDAGVLYQRMEMALLLGEIVERDLLRGGLAVELAIDVSRAGDFKGCEAGQRQQFPNQFRGNHTGRSFETAGQLEGHGQRVLAHLQIGRLLDGDVREFNMIFGLENRAKALAKKSLLFAIHVGSPTRPRPAWDRAKPLVFLPILAEGSATP